jgi:hypothetical protein
VASDFSHGPKATLTAVLGATPLLTKIVAIVITAPRRDIQADQVWRRDCFQQAVIGTSLTVVGLFAALST